MAEESRSFHYCGLFSNIQKQLCVQFIDIVTSKLVAVITLRKEEPPCIFPVGFRLWLVSHRHCASAAGAGRSQLPDGAPPQRLRLYCALRMGQGVCEAAEEHSCCYSLEVSAG